MIKWLRKKLGIDTIDKNIVESNSMTQNQLIEIYNSIENLKPKKKETEIIEIADSFNLKNDISDLGFKLNNNICIDKSWSLITTQNNKLNFLSQIAGTSSIGSSVAYTANGLYTATANTRSLMTYGNGSLSSITMNGSQFGSHAGFVSANPTVFTPILAVQFAAMLTGQYYFNGLTKQLESIKKGIDELINIYHNERLAKLRYINTKINELNNRNFFTTEDYVTVDRLKYDLSIIRFEYLLSAQKEIINTFERKKGDEKKEEIIDTISEDSSKLERRLITTKREVKIMSSRLSNLIKGVDDKIKPLTENSLKEINQIVRKINDSKFFKYSEIALKSEQLYQLIKIIELKINLSNKKPSPNRIGKIEEIYNSIIEFNFEDSIYDEMDQLKSDLKDHILTQIITHRNNSKLTRSEIDKRSSVILEEFSILEENLRDKELIFENLENIRNEFEKPLQILIDNRTNPTKIYTKL
ncbi:hypothetical protein E7Z59_10685 [Robertkochia marina]|uniref:Uncharacterized protein n=3 Tax=Robertkochia marina TaxID=1227945 RepID=A0A4S3LYB0_9FLAO|nr:hypothetical protein [Robertkochia marina]THD66275.1 hypothetical protein E7Z59_10685 [Robertkochia marina]